MIDFIRGDAKDANLDSFMRGWIIGHMHTGIQGTRLPHTE